MNEHETLKLAKIQSKKNADESKEDSGFSISKELRCRRQQQQNMQQNIRIHCLSILLCVFVCFFLVK